MLPVGHVTTPPQCVILRWKAYPTIVAFQCCAVHTVMAVQTRSQIKEEKQMEGKTANCGRDKDVFGVFPFRHSDAGLSNI
jgi:hypothetical protein